MQLIMSVCMYSEFIGKLSSFYRLKTLCTPAADLCNTSPKKTLYPETPPADTELCALTEKPKDGSSEGESPVIRDISNLML